MKNKITIICGHYGSGKTNLSLNLALESARQGKKTVLVDMDIVNPYFRSSEYGELLEKNGIRLIAPVTANTTLDTPVLPPELSSIFIDSSSNIFIDVGGDDVGITALATVGQQLRDYGYEMLYVINQSRVLLQSPQEAVELLSDIESVSGLKATAVVNNTHLGVETTEETVIASQSFAEETARLLKLPLLFSTIPSFASKSEKSNDENIKKIERLVLFPWEQESRE